MAEMNTGRAVETGKTGIPVPAFRYSLHGTFPAVKTLIFCLGIIRIPNPGSRADFHTKELTLRGPSSRGNRFPPEKAFRNYATETWTAASLSAVEMHAFRQDALAFRKESSLPPGLASGSRKRLRRSKRYGNHSILIHDGFGIRYDRFIRALMNHGRNDGFVPLPFTGCDSYNPIRIMFSISWFPFYSRSSSSFPLHAETVLQHYYPGL
jgi:hypothetical protein